MIILGWSVSGIDQVPAAFIRGEAVEESAGSLPSFLDSSLGSFAHQVLELGESLLDRFVMTTLECWFLLKLVTG